MSIPVRERFTREIRNVAIQASANAIDDIGSRLHILSLALAPELGTVERAIRHFEGASPFPTTEREQIASYVVSAIERRLLDGDKLIPLRHISENPLGWLDSFSRACVPSGITQVRRARMRDARAIGATLPEVGDTLTFPSAEDSYIGHVEQMHAELALRMLEENPSMGEWERHSIAAHTFARSLGVPLPHIGSNRDRRWICEQLERPEFAVELRSSLQAAHDLAAGSPEWDQLGVDGRLLDLWLDYTPSRSEALLGADPQKLESIVRGVAMFPPRPQEAERIAVRRAAKAASERRGWPSLVMVLERAWVAEFFDARPAHDNMDRRTDAEAEADRAADAEKWEDAAALVLAFPGSPAGADATTPSDVARWLGGLLAASS